MISQRYTHFAKLWRLMNWRVLSFQSFVPPNPNSYLETRTQPQYSLNQTSSNPNSYLHASKRSCVHTKNNNKVNTAKKSSLYFLKTLVFRTLYYKNTHTYTDQTFCLSQLSGPIWMNKIYLFTRLFVRAGFSLQPLLFLFFPPCEHEVAVEFCQIFQRSISSHNLAGSGSAQSPIYLALYLLLRLPSGATDSCCTVVSSQPKRNWSVKGQTYKSVLSKCYPSESECD